MAVNKHEIFYMVNHSLFILDKETNKRSSFPLQIADKHEMIYMHSANCLLITSCDNKRDFLAEIEVRLPEHGYELKVGLLRDEMKYRCFTGLTDYTGKIYVMAVESTGVEDTLQTLFLIDYTFKYYVVKQTRLPRQMDPSMIQKWTICGVSKAAITLSQFWSTLSTEILIDHTFSKTEWKHHSGKYINYNTRPTFEILRNKIPANWYFYGIFCTVCNKYVVLTCHGFTGKCRLILWHSFLVLARFENARKRPHFVLFNHGKTYITFDDSDRVYVYNSNGTMGCKVTYYNDAMQSKCRCEKDYEGSYCQHAKDPCSRNQCHAENTVICDDFNPPYKCICRQFYGGKFCNLTLPCYSNPCHNGGYCKSIRSVESVCVCSSGIYGSYCQFKRPINVRKFDQVVRQSYNVPKLEAIIIFHGFVIYNHFYSLNYALIDNKTAMGKETIIVKPYKVREFQQQVSNFIYSRMLGKLIVSFVLMDDVELIEVETMETVATKKLFTIHKLFKNSITAMLETNDAFYVSSIARSKTLLESTFLVKFDANLHGTQQVLHLKQRLHYRTFLTPLVMMHGRQLSLVVKRRYSRKHHNIFRGGSKTLSIIE